MATLAFRPHAFLVRFIVILAMAFHAIDLRILVGGVDMTLFTICEHMGTMQWKPGYSVIKHHFLGPTAFIVTLVTLLTFLPAVYIIVLMAGNTLLTQIFLEHHTLVAIFTINLHMLAAQAKLGVFIVIEAVIHPVLGGMANFAFFTVSALMLVA